jgi:diketogulonate reductase-like aldo/keto reductase
VPTPTLIYGTAWKEDDTARLVGLALDAGFRAFDTANQRRHYHEAGVGQGLRAFLDAGGRDALFLQAKFTYVRGQDHRLPYDAGAAPELQVRQSFASSLDHLGVQRLDALLLHGPELSQGWSATDQRVWRTMESLVDEGQLGRIGVSNMSAPQLAELLERARIAPAFVQNRCYASRAWDADVRALCASSGAIYQGFSLLTANRSVWGHATVAQIARRHGATPAMVILRFAQRLGMLPLTGTTDPRHIALDLQIDALPLDDDEVARIDALGR